MSTNLNCTVCAKKLPENDLLFLREICCGRGTHSHCLQKSRAQNKCSGCHSKIIQKTSPKYLKKLTKWVKKGECWAMTMLADLYRDGHLVKQSTEKALGLYYDAAALGDVVGLFNAGNLEANRGHWDSWSKARMCWEKAAALGLKDAMAAVQRLDKMEGKTSSVDSTLKCCSSCQQPATVYRTLKECVCTATQYCNTAVSLACHFVSYYTCTLINLFFFLSSTHHNLKIFSVK